MRDEPTGARPAAVVAVRCLDCGHVYAKPANGGTVEENPGCPDCGYLGWVVADLEVTAPRRQRRSVADLRRHRESRSR